MHRALVVVGTVHCRAGLAHARQERLAAVAHHLDVAHHVHVRHRHQPFRAEELADLDLQLQRFLDRRALGRRAAFSFRQV
jgi:hypothetical protein